MTKQYYYIYVGDNGSIESPVHLPNVPCVKKCRLYADENKLLTKDNKIFKHIVTIPVTEIDEWREVDNRGQI